jgi:hypothetical protein
VFWLVPDPPLWLELKLIVLPELKKCLAFSAELKDTVIVQVAKVVQAEPYKPGHEVEVVPLFEVIR